MMAALVALLGERTAPAEPAQRRTAVLAPRSTYSAVRLRTWSLLSASLGTLVGLLAWSCAVATPDDHGRHGRAVTWSTRAGSQAHTPWPGSFYAWPLAPAVAVLLVCTVAALQAASRRKQANADARGAMSDAVLRRESAAFVMRVALLTTAVTLAGVSLVIGSATALREDGTPTWVGVMHWISRTTLVLVAVTALAAIRPVRPHPATSDGVRENGGVDGVER